MNSFLSINIIICVLIFLSIFGCNQNQNLLSQWSSDPQEKPIVEQVPTESLTQAEYWIQKKDPEKAIAALQPINEETADVKLLYLLGNAYNLQGNYTNALRCYRNILIKDARFYDAYQASKNVYRIITVDIRKEFESIQNLRYEAKNKGDDQLPDIQKKYQSLLESRSNIYLEQAEFYLLYQETEMNISDFPEIEAHLRDTQDLLKELEEGRIRPYTKLEKIDNPLYNKILDMRAKITKKHIRSLLDLAETAAQQKDFYKAINSAKDADAQVGKFYREEEPTADVSILAVDSEVAELADQTQQSLLKYSEQALGVHHKNIANLQQIQEMQQADDELKVIEQILENMIQIKIQSFWRLQNLKKEVSENHPDLIKLYERFLQEVPNSSKAGDYAYRLGWYYANNRDKNRAWKYAKEAEQKLGNYRVKDLFEALEK